MSVCLSVCVSEVKVYVYECISMQIFVRAFLLGVRLGMKTNVVVRYDEKMYSIRAIVWGDPIRFHQNDVIIRSHILILHVDRNVKQYSSTTVT